MAADRAEAGRVAAYADLVAAVLDLRSPEATTRFDQALTQASAEGQITPDLARQLRTLQRDAERSLVDHAAAVLPAALVALDRSHGSSDPGVAASASQPVEPDGATPTTDSADEPLTEAVPEPPADLTARRLLVAGLRPINDPHHGSIP